MSCVPYCMFQPTVVVSHLFPCHELDRLSERIFCVGKKVKFYRLRLSH